MTKRCWCSQACEPPEQTTGEAGSTRPRMDRGGSDPPGRCRCTVAIPSVGADDEYQFRLDVTVPADAEPGQAAFTVIPPDWVTINGSTARDR